ncbi:MAG: hypothetical protein ACFFCS_06065 [Candidatus Hodarchaeota archaeon]
MGIRPPLDNDGRAFCIRATIPYPLGFLTTDDRATVWGGNHWCRDHIHRSQYFYWLGLVNLGSLTKAPAFL